MMIEQPFKKIRNKREAVLAAIDGLLHGSPLDSTSGNSSMRRVSGPHAEPELSIRNFMTRAPITIRVETPLRDALGILIQKDLSSLPVVDDNDKIVGLLNERHVLRAVGDPDGTTIVSVMDTKPVTVEIHEPIVEVVDRLMAINVRQVLVLECSTLVGVVTRADLMPAVLEMLRKRGQGIHSPVH